MVESEWEEESKKNNKAEGGWTGEGSWDDTVMGNHIRSLPQTLQLLASSVLLFCFHMALNLSVWTTNRC